MQHPQKRDLIQEDEKNQAGEVGMTEKKEKGKGKRRPPARDFRMRSGRRLDEQSPTGPKESPTTFLEAN